MIYIGVRVELSNRARIKDLKKRYAEKYNKQDIFDFHGQGRIILEKKGDMLIARGKDEEHTGLANFSILTAVEEKKEDAEKVIKIVNVLGNDRLIREKIKSFVDHKSVLNKIEEFSGLMEIIYNLQSLVPGFINSSYYYAPEIKWK